MKHDWRDVASTTALIVGTVAIALILLRQDRLNLTTLIPKGSRSQPSTATKLTSSLSPKEAVRQYYQLAPTNKTAALSLLSEPWRKAEQSKATSSANFWDLIDRVDVYALKTLKKNSQVATVKSWLKYYPKGKSDTSCESITFQLIHDNQTNQWLMDSASDVVQKMNCDI